MKIGAQLYNVRNYCQTERDFRRSMKRIADAGFGVVQLSGAGPIAPEAIREACDENGLTIALTHSNPDRILADTDAVIREHEILGCRYIGIGGMPGRYQTKEWIHCFAEDFTEPAKKMRDKGMKLMYHNHNFEFERIEGRDRMIDILLREMPEDLMGVTMDTYWIQAAGADVCEWLKILENRIPCMHIKDMTVKGFTQRFAPIGDGNINFEKILRQVAEQGKTEYILIEQDDSYGADPFECLARGGEYVRSLGYETK